MLCLSTGNSARTLSSSVGVVCVVAGLPRGLSVDLEDEVIMRNEDGLAVLGG